MIPPSVRERSDATEAPEEFEDDDEDHAEVEPTT
jgi:hypothetical protein